MFFWSVLTEAVNFFEERYLMLDVIFFPRRKVSFLNDSSGAQVDWRSAYDDIHVKRQIKQVKWKLKKLGSGRRVWARSRGWVCLSHPEGQTKKRATLVNVPLESGEELRKAAAWGASELASHPASAPSLRQPPIVSVAG